MKRLITKESTNRILNPEGHLVSDSKRAPILSRARKISGLVLAALLLLPYIAMPVGQHLDPEALAEPTTGSKVSPGLSDKLGKADPSERVSVIIQTRGIPSRALVNAANNEGGNVRRTFKNVDGVVVDLPAAAVAALANRSDVRYMSFDEPTQATGHLETTTGADQVRSYGSVGTVDGTGIGIAILDSGIYTSHSDFGGGYRVRASIDFTGENRTDDPYGHGSHVAGCAAGNGSVSLGAYTGIAPNANLINVRVLNSNGQGKISDAIAGIDWCISNKAVYNIRVMNLSFGTTAVDTYSNDPLCQAVRTAFNAGIVVCVAAGNDGRDSYGNKIYGGIVSPGIEPSAVTVGAVNTYGSDYHIDDTVASYSSRGPTRSYWTDVLGVKHYDDLIKPDLVAPGNKILEAESPNNWLVTNNPQLEGYVSSSPKKDQMYLSGTSMATPVVAGAAALMIQVNPNLTPNLVKAILEYTADPLPNCNTFEQGAGELNVEGAVRLSALVRTDLSLCVLGSPLLCSTCNAPTQWTTIGGVSFQWGGGIIQKWNFIYGSGLITQYQGVYGTGTLLTDGALLSSGTLLCNGTLLTNGTLLSSGTLLSDGTLLSSGTLLTEGTLLANGTLLTDGTLLADGTLLSDSVIATTSSFGTSSLRASFGDQTVGMNPVADPTPSNLSASVIAASQINLTWKDNCSIETGYNVQRSSDGVNFTTIATLGANATAYSSIGLSSGTTYYYRVFAVTSIGNTDYSNVSSATTTR